MAPKPLYLAKSLAELQKMCELGNVSTFKCKSLQGSSEKLIKEAVHQNDMGDEEKAYILYYKYIKIYQLIKKHKEYKADKKYWDSMMGDSGKTFKNAIEKLESLQVALERRYTAKELDQVQLKLSKTTITKGDVNGNDNIAADRNEISDPKEVVDQLNLVTALKLFSLIREKCTTFFILDTRSAADYQTSHVSLPTSINIPESLLTPGTTTRAIAKNLAIESRDAWSKRGNKDMLIICDWSSETLEPGKPISVLYDALTKWDVETTYKNTPYLLKGGFENFLFAYPHYVTNPRARAPEERSDSVNDIPSLDFEYPDLDKAFMTTPSPGFRANNAAISSGAIKIERSGTGTPKGPQAMPRIDRSTKPSDNGGSWADSLSSHGPPDILNDNARESGAFNTNGSTRLSSTSSSSEFSLNNARLSGISEFQSPVRDVSSATYDSSHNDLISRLNNARISSNSSIGSSIASNALNNAVIDIVEASVKPVVDRTKKEQAVERYNVDDALKVEEDLLEKSMDREKKHLEMEKEWEVMRLKKEKEHEENMGEIMKLEQAELWKQLDTLREENKMKDIEDAKLRGELANVRKELEQSNRLAKTHEMLHSEREAQQRIKAKEEEARRLKEEVELKRQKRKEEEIRKEKRLREEQIRNEEARERELVEKQKREEHESGFKGAKGCREKLKMDGEGGGMGKRSFSSPNIAQMMEQEDRAANGQLFQMNKLAPFPKFDRNIKPKIQSRNFAGVWGTGKPGLTGLKNMGNTCYMNSILQCVSNTAPLANYFVTGGFENDLNPQSETRGQISKEFAEVLIRLWNSQYKSICPTDLKRTIGRYKREFSGSDQQDSHEFVITLMDWLHKETNKIHRPSKEPEQKNENLPDYVAANNHWKEFIARNQSIFIQLFHGQRRSVVKCLTCGTESVTYDVFSVLTLPIPAGTNRVNLIDCFTAYLKEEVLDEWKCPTCRVNRKSLKKIDIVKFPPLLVIHLNRFYNDGLWRKKQNYVSFDLNNLDLGRFATANSRHNNRYSQFNLYSVSNHYGTMEGGHYTAYCKSDILGSWYKYDDQVVTPMDSKDVTSSASYLLFYTAIDDLNTLPPLG